MAQDTIPGRRKGDVADQVHRELKDLILQYEFRPGERLITQELAERFGVSRTPVNQALARLEREGHVTWRPNRGYQIAEINPQEATELYGLREALEAFAVDQAVERQTPEWLEQLRAKMDAYAALGDEPLSRRKLLLDEEIHLAIAEMGGNTKLREILESVFERLIMKRKIEGAQSRGRATGHEHQAIFEAIAARDTATAVERTRDHVRKDRDNLLHQMEQKRSLFLAPRE